MISRSTAIALAFAILATLSVTVTAQVRHSQPVLARTSTPMAVIELPRVVVTGRVVRDAAL